MSTLLALLVRQQAIVRVDLPSGRVDVLTDDAGAAPDGIAVVGNTVYWTTMGVPQLIPGVPGEAGRDYSPGTAGSTPSNWTAPDVATSCPTAP